jgi:hypothetical protein
MLLAKWFADGLANCIVPIQIEAIGPSDGITFFSECGKG